MKELFDDFCLEKSKKVITHTKHRVPGLGNFSYWNYNTSIEPSPLHYHSNIYEFHCLIRGKRLSVVNRAGQSSTYTTMGNQICIMFPFEIHGNGKMPQMPCEFYAFQIDISNPTNLLGLNAKYSLELYHVLKNINTRQLQLGATHINFLRSAFNFFMDMSPSSIAIGVQYLTCFLFNLQFLNSIESVQSHNINASIQRSIRYLEDHLTDQISLYELANASGYSLSHFKTKFKKEMGITPSEYIMVKKIEYAKESLRKSDITVTELAYYLGFSSSNYFASVFKKIMGISPQKYRQITL